MTAATEYELLSALQAQVFALREDCVKPIFIMGSGEEIFSVKGDGFAWVHVPRNLLRKAWPSPMYGMMKTCLGFPVIEINDDHVLRALVGPLDGRASLKRDGDG